MRKYDGKNKRNIGIIVGFCIIFAVIFSYFLFQQIKISKIKYELEESTVLFDIDKNSLLLNSTGTIKKKWNKKYYLTYEKEQYNIGTHVIAYNNNENSLTLYGVFYQINRNSEVVSTKEETKINNLGISRFYKIADRKYLIVDPDIKSEDQSLKTTNYLIIELDKQGNAILYNNSLNVKVFSATKIATTTFTFDIANELLLFDNEEIDLKKILGTTNEYKENIKPVKPEKNEQEETGDGGGAGTGNGNGIGTGTENGGGDGAGEEDTGNQNNGTTEDGVVIPETEIINQTAYTSIIRIAPSANSISIDYVIYDKLNKYIDTFVEIRSDEGYYNKVHLSKSRTNATITNLNPGVKYTLTFKYTTLQDELVREEVIDTQTVTTLIPNIKLTGTKVTGKIIDYEIKISSFNIDRAKLRLYIDDVKQDKEMNINSDNLDSVFSIAGIIFPNNALIELRLEDIYVGYWLNDDTYINGLRINKTFSWSYKTSNIHNPNPDDPNGDESNQETPIEPPLNPENPGGEEPTPDDPTPDTPKPEEPIPDTPGNEEE